MCILALDPAKVKVRLIFNHLFFSCFKYLHASVRGKISKRLCEQSSLPPSPHCPGSVLLHNNCLNNEALSRSSLRVCNAWKTVTQKKLSLPNCATTHRPSPHYVVRSVMEETSCCECLLVVTSHLA